MANWQENDNGRQISLVREFQNFGVTAKVVPSWKALLALDGRGHNKSNNDGSGWEGFSGMKQSIGMLAPYHIGL